MKILVVEDSKAMRTHLQNHLQEAGYKEVLAAASAKEAFEYLGIKGDKMESLPLDVGCILMDVVMPEIDGIEACRKIKSFYCYKYVPIIMVSASEQIDHLQRAFDAGAIDYIKKPVNETELIARVRTMLKLKREIDERIEKEDSLTTLTDQLKESNVALEKLSFRDAVTGLSNRFHLERQLFTEWRRALRYKNWISLIIFELDHFAKYFDNNEENIVNTNLVKISKEISSKLKRPADLVARIDEGRFAILLPDTNLEGATIVSENVRSSIEFLNIKNTALGEDKTLTISGGTFTVVPLKNLNPPLLFERAEIALSQAKAGGRNRIVVISNKKTI